MDADDEVRGVPGVIVVSLDYGMRVRLALLAGWMRTDRYPEVLRRCLRAAAVHLEGARARGEEPEPPVIPVDLRGRKKGGARRRDMLADAVREVSEYRRLAAAREEWNHRMLAAGIEPSDPGVEAERWREMWRHVETVVMAKDRSLQPKVQPPAASVSPQRGSGGGRDGRR